MFLNYCDSVLRGIGQVMLQNNRYAGLLFLVGVGINSWVLALGILLGTLVSTATAYALPIAKQDIEDGLYGFNGALVGLALLIFLTPTPLTFLSLVLAAAFSTLLMRGLTNLLKQWDIPAFTAPFVFISWMFFLSNARFGRLESTHLLPTAGLPKLSRVEGVVTFDTILDGTLNGIGQVFFQGSVISGLIFLAALLVGSRLSALMAVLGSLIGLSVAWLWGASEPSIHIGAWGFNSVLVGIALAVLLPKFGAKELAFSVLAMAITPFVYAALSAALEPIGMPALTFPFVLVSWVFLFALKNTASAP
ncbi:MAG: urea transporter [Venatoribacter sp.]